MHLSIIPACMFCFFVYFELDCSHSQVLLDADDLFPLEMCSFVDAQFIFSLAL